MMTGEWRFAVVSVDRKCWTSAFALVDGPRVIILAEDLQPIVRKGFAPEIRLALCEPVGPLRQRSLDRLTQFERSA